MKQSTTYPTALLHAVSDFGKSKSVEDFPIVKAYMDDTDGMFPNLKSFSNIACNYQGIYDEFETWKIQPTVLYKKEAIDEDTYEFDEDYVVLRIQQGYFMLLSVWKSLSTEYQNIAEGTVKVCSVQFLVPGENSLKSDILEKKIVKLLKKHSLKPNDTIPSVGMILQEDGDFYLKDFYIKEDYSLKEADLHYGEGFSQFHKNVLLRFKKDHKGLFLFHGNPGTGKTYYIRSLLKELISIDKYIIYVPPSMIDYIVSPEMMAFISSTVMEKSEQKKSCVLLLEDAEPLLTSRKDENRSNGITNLLNLTDGFLNDMLGIQVIATFNTELVRIDEALLRPERLTARKEFKPLSIKDAQALSDKLKLGLTIDKDSTLAEIYSQSKKKEILIHEYKSPERKIGFR